MRTGTEWFAGHSALTKWFVLPVVHFFCLFCITGGDRGTLRKSDGKRENARHTEKVRPGEFLRDPERPSEGEGG